MQEAVRKLKELGVPPEGVEDAVLPGEDGFPFEETIGFGGGYQNAADAAARPVTWEEAGIFMKCCPTAHMAGIERTILHCTESGFVPEAAESCRNLTGKCSPDMMRNMLLERLRNDIHYRLPACWGSCLQRRLRCVWTNGPGTRL